MLDTGFILLIFCSLVFSCTTKNNKTIEYYPNGKKKLITTFYDAEDKKCAHFFYPNGKLKKEYCTVNDSLEGIFKSYHDNGNLKSTVLYESGKMEGELKFFRSNGNLEELAYTKNGKLNGELRYYSNNGNLKAENFFVEDSLHYKKIYFYDSLGMFVSAPETYRPLVGISSDTINLGDALEVHFSLPLPKERFVLDNFTVEFDFMSVSEARKTEGFAKPSFSLSLKNGENNNGYFIQDRGDIVLYGQVCSMDGGKKIRSEWFEKRFYVE